MSGPELRTCSQCGSAQVEGEFCERCGAQLPRPAAGAAAVLHPAPAAPMVPPPAAPAPPVAQAPVAPPVPAAPGYIPPAQHHPAGGFPPPSQYQPPGSYPPAGGQPHAPVPPGHGFGGSGGFGGPPQGPFGGGGPRDGFIASLFDLSFHHFVTPKIIKVLFILALIGIGFATLTMIIVGFGRGFVAGILFLILALILGFVYILLARLWLEVVVVLFRIEEHTAAMAEQNKK